MNAFGKAPDALFRSPEAAIGKDGHFESLGDFLEVLAGDVMLVSVDVGHFLRTARQSFFGRDQFCVTAGNHVEEAHEESFLVVGHGFSERIEFVGHEGCANATVVDLSNGAVGKECGAGSSCEDAC